jgi:hypothetical protein
LERQSKNLEKSDFLKRAKLVSTCLALVEAYVLGSSAQWPQQAVQKAWPGRPVWRSLHQNLFRLVAQRPQETHRLPRTDIPRSDVSPLCGLRCCCNRPTTASSINPQSSIRNVNGGKKLDIPLLRTKTDLLRSDFEPRLQAACHGNQIPYLVRGPSQNLLRPT